MFDDHFCAYLLNISSRGSNATWSCLFFNYLTLLKPDGCVAWFLLDEWMLGPSHISIHVWTQHVWVVRVCLCISRLPLCSEPWINCLIFLISYIWLQFSVLGHFVLFSKSKKFLWININLQKGTKSKYQANSTMMMLSKKAGTDTYCRYHPTRFSCVCPLMWLIPTLSREWTRTIRGLSYWYKRRDSWDLC